MKLPICTQDAEEGELCSECKEKLEEGEINETDVELSKILYRLRRKDTIPEGVGLVKTKELEGSVLALIEGNPALLIGRGGRIIRMISDELGEKIRVIKNGDMIQITNDLIAPIRACGLNKLYKCNGDVQEIITLPREEKNTINMSLDEVEKAVNEVTDGEYRIKFI